LAATLDLSYFHFGNSCPWRKFSARVDVFQVLVHSRYLYAEKVGHCPLREPEIIVRKEDIHRHLPIGGLVKHDLRLI